MAGLRIEIVSPLYNETKDRLPTLPMPMKQAIQSALDRANRIRRPKRFSHPTSPTLVFCRRLRKAAFAGTRQIRDAQVRPQAGALESDA